MEPTVSVGSKTVAAIFKASYSQYMEWKFVRLEDQARRRDLSIETLMSSDERFATFMRISRAFEQCHEEEVVDFLAEAMIGGVQCGRFESQPDMAQMVIGALTGVTKTELCILLLMRENGLYLDDPKRANNKDCKDKFVSACQQKLGLTPTMLAAITNGLARTGLVTTETPAVGGPSPNSNKLTELARELFSYIDCAKRLTQ